MRTVESFRESFVRAMVAQEQTVDELLARGYKPEEIDLAIKAHHDRRVERHARRAMARKHPTAVFGTDAPKGRWI